MAKKKKVEKVETEGRRSVKSLIDNANSRMAEHARLATKNPDHKGPMIKYDWLKEKDSKSGELVSFLSFRTSDEQKMELFNIRVDHPKGENEADQDMRVMSMLIGEVFNYGISFLLTISHEALRRKSEGATMMTDEDNAKVEAIKEKVTAKATGMHKV